MLKGIQFIPPVVALAAVLAWNRAETKSLRSIEEEEAALRQVVAETRVRPSRMDGQTRGAKSGRAVLGAGGEIDWKMVARKVGGGGNGLVLTDMRLATDLYNEVSKMGLDEILSALDKIQMMDLGAEERSELESLLFDPLVEKDPAKALERFADRIGNDDDAIGWQLAGAMAQWAKKDPKAAAAWLDQQIAAGVFDPKSLDGRSQSRLEFEGALVAELLATDPNAAAARIESLPGDQRREAMEQISFSELGADAQAAYTEMIRGLVPGDERAGSFTHIISDLVENQGFEEVGSFLDMVKATPDERATSSRQAVNSHFGLIATERPLTHKDVDEAQAWIRKQAPGTEDPVTGEALGDAAQDGGEFTFKDASKLALHYHRRSKGDDVLISFLESFEARSNADQAIHLAQKIRDPKKRQQVLEDLQ